MVDHGHGRVGVVDQRAEPAPSERGAGSRRSGGVGHQPGQGVLDGVGHLGAPGDEPGQAVGAVLGLHHQVDGHVVGRRLLVGHDHDLRRPGEGHGYAHLPGHLALGQGHVDVPRAGDHVDGTDRRRAVGHGSDGLGTSDGVDPRPPPARAAAARVAGATPDPSPGQEGRRAPPRAPLPPAPAPPSSPPRRDRRPARRGRSTRPGRPGTVRPSTTIPPRREMWSGRCWPSWKARTESQACPRASRSSAGIWSTAARTSPAGTRNDSARTPSKRSVYSRTASSPRARTSATISLTASMGPSPPGSGRGSPASRSGPVQPRRSRRSSTTADDSGRGRGAPPPDTAGATLPTRRSASRSTVTTRRSIEPPVSAAGG